MSSHKAVKRTTIKGSSPDILDVAAMVSQNPMLKLAADFSKPTYDRIEKEYSTQHNSIRQQVENINEMVQQPQHNSIRQQVENINEMVQQLVKQINDTTTSSAQTSEQYPDVPAIVQREISPDVDEETVITEERAVVDNLPRYRGLKGVLQSKNRTKAPEKTSYITVINKHRKRRGVKTISGTEPEFNPTGAPVRRFLSKPKVVKPTGQVENPAKLAESPTEPVESPAEPVEVEEESETQNPYASLV